MSNTALSLALAPGLGGALLSSAASPFFLRAMSGGAGTAAFAQAELGAMTFFQALTTMGSSAFSQGVDAAGNPTFTASQGAYQMVVEPVLDPSVTRGSAPTGQFSWNGSQFNIVGALTTTLSFEEQPIWHYEAALGVVEAFPIASLGSIAWTSVLAPLLQGFVRGVASAIASAAGVTTDAEAAAAAAAAAEEAAVEDAVVGDLSVSLEVGPLALVGLLVLAALPFIISLLAHPTYHHVKVYNLTSFDVTWQVNVTEGAMSTAPTTGAGGASSQLIPPISSFAPPGITPVPVAHEADFSFVSTSELEGLSYTMALAVTDPATGGSPVEVQPVITFDIPFSGENRIDGQPTTIVAKNLGGGVEMTVTLDFLTGEHPLPNGGTGFLYNSLVVVWQPGNLPTG